jgi:hypothetical protein
MENLTTTTFATYIPVVPQTEAPMAPPKRVADFDPGVVGVLLALVVALAVLGRGR